MSVRLKVCNHGAFLFDVFVLVMQVENRVRFLCAPFFSGANNLVYKLARILLFWRIGFCQVNIF